MTDNRTKCLMAMLEERGVKHKLEHDLYVEWVDARGNEVTAFRTSCKHRGDVLIVHVFLTPEQAIAATLGDETPKRCSTCQYRYAVGQRPYPTFGYMCGFGDGKKLCGDDTSVLDHMCCEHWEKELK